MDFGQFAGNMLGFLAVVGVILVVIFLVCREIVCWYFKINQNVALLTEIRDLLASKGISLNSMRAAERAQHVPQRCPGCGAAVVDVGSAFCTKCGAKI